MRNNLIKPGLKAGKSFIGTFSKITDPAIVEALALAGFEFTIIDNEHTAMNKESMVNLIRAAEIHNLPATVRVRESSTADILQALDAGALGVQVPQVESKAEAQKVVDAVKYAPLGKRGYAASQRSARYGTMNPTEYAHLANENTMVSVYCETAASIDNLDEILTVDQVDIIFIGPFDLSQALGVTGQPAHPRVIDAIQTITRKTRAAGKAAGIIAANPTQTRQWLDMGIQYIALSSDLALILNLGGQMLKELGR